LFSVEHHEKVLVVIRLQASVRDIRCSVWDRAAARANTNCTGSLTGTIDHNVTVPSGQRCTLTDVMVNGNVKVGQEATLTANGGEFLATFRVITATL
jgi:autotransporter adhesin